MTKLQAADDGKSGQSGQSGKSGESEDSGSGKKKSGKKKLAGATDRKKLAEQNRRLAESAGRVLHQLILLGSGVVKQKIISTIIATVQQPGSTPPEDVPALMTILRSAAEEQLALVQKLDSLSGLLSALEFGRWIKVPALKLGEARKNFMTAQEEHKRRVRKALGAPSAEAPTAAELPAGALADAPAAEAAAQAHSEGALPEQAKETSRLVAIYDELRAMDESGVWTRASAKRRGALEKEALKLEAAEKALKLEAARKPRGVAAGARSPTTTKAAAGHVASPATAATSRSNEGSSALSRRKKRAPRSPSFKRRKKLQAELGRPLIFTELAELAEKAAAEKEKRTSQRGRRTPDRHLMHALATSSECNLVWDANGPIARATDGGLLGPMEPRGLRVDAEAHFMAQEAYEYSKSSRMPAKRADVAMPTTTDSWIRGFASSPAGAAPLAPAPAPAPVAAPPVLTRSRASAGRTAPPAPTGHDDALLASSPSLGSHPSSFRSVSLSPSPLGSHPDGFRSLSPIPFGSHPDGSRSLSPIPFGSHPDGFIHSAHPSLPPDSYPQVLW